MIWTDSEEVGVSQQLRKGQTTGRQHVLGVLFNGNMESLPSISISQKVTSVSVSNPKDLFVVVFVVVLAFGSEGGDQFFSDNLD